MYSENYKNFLSESLKRYIKTIMVIILEKTFMSKRNQTKKKEKKISFLQQDIFVAVFRQEMAGLLCPGTISLSAGKGKQHIGCY